ncbi:hypothetical protein FOC4_g10006207 [Fusarium odoratissimum]|uniref:Uncharacterized protein n=1 Tax=Fusarium oxysporum f. sp. cubense (strain race 4) TaxID=2502994 RepID=N1RAU7_FUSC4|nr:hypothetical protein FOC4_g10006207 [Fusarium odoratissimum]
MRELKVLARTPHGQSNSYQSSLPKKGCARLKDSMHVMQRHFFTCGQDPNRSV